MQVNQSKMSDANEKYILDNLHQIDKENGLFIIKDQDYLVLLFIHLLEEDSKIPIR